MLHAIYGSIYISKGLRNGWQSNSPLQLGGWPWTCVQVRTCNNSDIKWQFIASFEPGLSISVGYKQHIAAVFDICQMWLLSPIVIWNLYYLQFHQFKPMKITSGTWSDTEHWTVNIGPLNAVLISPDLHMVCLDWGFGNQATIRTIFYLRSYWAVPPNKIIIQTSPHLYLMR